VSCSKTERCRSQINSFATIRKARSVTRLLAGRGYPVERTGGDGANTMTPSRFQAPPRLFDASPSVTGGPPASAILFIFPSAKNPIEALSGDQKRYCPTPSVPGRTLAASESSSRTHSRCAPRQPILTARLPERSSRRCGFEQAELSAGLPSHRHHDRVLGLLQTAGLVLPKANLEAFERERKN